MGTRKDLQGAYTTRLLGGRYKRNALTWLMETSSCCVGLFFFFVFYVDGEGYI